MTKTKRRMRKSREPEPKITVLLRYTTLETWWSEGERWQTSALNPYDKVTAHCITTTPGLLVMTGRRYPLGIITNSWSTVPDFIDMIELEPEEEIE